jgi:hypothetical protein
MTHVLRAYQMIKRKKRRLSWILDKPVGLEAEIILRILRPRTTTVITCG